MGNNDNRVVTQRALNSFITSNGGTVVASDSDVALVYSEITSASYAPQYQSNNGVVTSAGIKVSDYTGIGGGAYTANQVVIERDVTWESASRIPTTGISISGPSQVAVGDTITLIATLTPADATDPVVWTIDDTTKATIDQNGVVTGVAEGTVTVTATSNGISATHQVEVTRAYNPASTANVGVTAYHKTVIFKDLNPVENPSATEYSIFGSHDEGNYGLTIENFFTYTTGTTKTFYIIPDVNYSYSHLRAEYGTNRNTDIKVFTSDVTVEYIGTWSNRPVYAATFTLNPQIDGEYGIFFDIYTQSPWLNVDDIEVPVGGTVQSSYYTLNESQHPEPVSYHTGDVSIATVDSNGVVTGVSEGTTSILVVGSDYSFGQADVKVTASSGTGGESGGGDLPEVVFSNSIKDTLNTFDVFGTYDYDTAINDSNEYDQLTSAGDYDQTTTFDTSEGTATAFRKTDASFTISCSSAEEAEGISVGTYEYSYNGDWNNVPSSNWLSASTEVDGTNVIVHYNGLSDNVGGNDLWAYLLITAADGSWEAYKVHQNSTHGPGSTVGHGGSGRTFDVNAYPTYAWNASWSNSDKIAEEHNYGGNASVTYSEDVSNPTCTFSSNMGKPDETCTF